MLLLLSVTALECGAQEKVDFDVIARIKEEAYQHSQVMETLSYLADVFGPRLSGSPAYYEAAKWAKQRLESWGIENVHFDSYRDDLRGWVIESYSLEMIAPRYMNITGLPDAWTTGTNGEITGSPVIVDHSSMEALKKLSGQLRGKILMSPELRSQGPKREGLFTDDELAQSESRMNARPARGLTADNVRPSLEMIQDRMNREDSEADRINRFLLDEGVAAVIRGSSKAPGTLDARQQQYSKKGEMKPIPHFVISKEQHASMLRMIDRDVGITLKLHLNVRFNENPNYNTKETLIYSVNGYNTDHHSKLHGDFGNASTNARR